jgi:uncharacterized membrane protein
MSWEAYVDLAFDEIRIAGAGSPPVVRRLAAALNDLRSIAPPERQRVLDEQLDRLRFAAREAMRDERDATAALGFGPLRDDVLARVSTEREEAIGGR